MPCDPAACQQTTVIAVDNGLVFVDTADGTWVWDPSGNEATRWTRLTDRGSAVVAVRNSTVLQQGSPTEVASLPTDSPIDDSWTFEGDAAVDAQLSLDGRWVLYWSNTLRAVEPAKDKPVRLDLPGNYVSATFDTDGSVLAVVVDSSARSDGPSDGATGYAVLDCAIPSGDCTTVEDRIADGEPILVGNDM